MLVFPMLLALVLLHEARLVDLSFNFVVHSSVSLISVKIPQVSNYSTIRYKFSTCLSARFFQISSTSAFNVSLAYLFCWTLLAPKILVSHFKPLGSKSLIPYITSLFCSSFNRFSLVFPILSPSTLFIEFSDFRFSNYIPTYASLIFFVYYKYNFRLSMQVSKLCFTFRSLLY